MATNKDGYTPEEQNDMDITKKVKKIGSGESNLVLDYIDMLTGRKKAPKTPLKKKQTYKVMPSSPNMAVIAKKKAVAKKAGKK